MLETGKWQWEYVDFEYDGDCKSDCDRDRGSDSSCDRVGDEYGDTDCDVYDIFDIDVGFRRTTYPDGDCGSMSDSDIEVVCDSYDHGYCEGDRDNDEGDDGDC